MDFSNVDDIETLDELYEIELKKLELRKSYLLRKAQLKAPADVQKKPVKKEVKKEVNASRKETLQKEFNKLFD
jgi:hypothetical protein